jgi:hypothetical protein
MALLFQIFREKATQTSLGQPACGEQNAKVRPRGKMVALLESSGAPDHFSSWADAFLARPRFIVAQEKSELLLLKKLIQILFRAQIKTAVRVVRSGGIFSIIIPKR